VAGCTISGGLICGMERESAATFSFLIAIPVIGGAVLLDAVKLLSPGSADALNVPWGIYGMGALVSFFVGIAALRFLIRMLSKQKLHWFAYYCLIAGAVTIGWQACEGKW